MIKNPIAADDPEQRNRLLSYLWPDQATRIERLEGALRLAAQSGLTVDRADAADWVEAHFSARPGVATVLYHSIFWQYLPAGTQARIEGSILSAGAAATADAPVAWLRMEPDPDGSNAALYLDYWPGDVSRKLADRRLPWTLGRPQPLTAEPFIFKDDCRRYGPPDGRMAALHANGGRKVRAPRRHGAG